MQIPQNVRMERIALENKTRSLIKNKPLLEEYFNFHYADESDYNISVQSLSHYIKIIIRFLDYASEALAVDVTNLSKENHNLDLVDESLVNQFVKNLPYLKDSILPPSGHKNERMPAEITTITNYRISLNSFFRWLEKMGYIKENPVKHTIRKSQKKIINSMKKINKYLTDEESKALMELSLHGQAIIYGRHVSLTSKQLDFHKKSSYL